jgi:hypothetical protein
VEYEVVPEPSKDDREALEQALAALLTPPAPPASAWWRRGVEENALGEELEEGSLDG